jgi:hypothetical protein
MERSVFELVKDRLAGALCDGAEDYELVALTRQLARGLPPEERGRLWQYCFALLTRDEEAEDSRSRDRSTSPTTPEEGAKNEQPSR